MSLSVPFNFEQESVAHSQTVEAFARKRRFSTISNAYVHMTRATRLQYGYLQTDLQRTHDDTSHVVVIPFKLQRTLYASSSRSRFNLYRASYNLTACFRREGCRPFGLLTGEGNINSNGAVTPADVTSHPSFHRPRYLLGLPQPSPLAFKALLVCWRDGVMKR